MSNLEAIRQQQQVHNHEEADAIPITLPVIRITMQDMTHLMIHQLIHENASLRQNFEDTANGQQEQISALASENIHLQNQINDLRSRAEAPSYISRAWSFIKNHATKQNLIAAGVLVVAATAATCKAIYG